MIRLFFYKDPRLLAREQKKDIRQKFTESVLRHQLGLSPEALLRVARHDRGKPYLPDYPSFHFNQSDSSEWMVIGTSETEIGIERNEIDIFSWVRQGDSISEIIEKGGYF